MKKLILALTILTAMVACSNIKNGKTESFKVWGNCGMCKKTIEKALESEGVKGDWDKKTKTIKVTYDSVKFTNQQVHEMISNAGYDTEKSLGNDKAYSQLHTCCKYKRKKN